MALPSGVEEVKEDDICNAAGVVDLTVLWEEEVLKLLDNVSKYLYVSGMAVKPSNRCLFTQSQEPAVSWPLFTNLLPCFSLF